jgi:hypothetical protein
MKTVEKPSMVEPKVVNLSIHVVDVNVAITRSKVTKEQMFNDRKPIKNKSVVD